LIPWFQGVKDVNSKKAEDLIWFAVWFIYRQIVALSLVATPQT